MHLAPALAALSLLLPAQSASPGVRPNASLIQAGDPAPLARGYRSRALAGGWGHSWLHGWPGYGKAISDVQFVGFYPQMGWFVSDELELYGEGTLHAYYRPGAEVLGGIVGIGGRWHFRTDASWTPYFTMAGGLAWTSLDVPEVDRIFNFQVILGAGIRQITRRGPGLLIEFRNHHISNAGTRGENLGINAGMLVVGVHWVLR